MQYLGIDAGGTRTRAVLTCEPALLDVGTMRLETHTFGPGNFRHLGETGVRRLVREILEAFHIDAPRETRILAGFAGAGTSESRNLRGSTPSKGEGAVMQNQIPLSPPLQRGERGDFPIQETSHAAIWQLSRHN